jgi:hypothetical protein
VAVLSLGQIPIGVVVGEGSRGGRVGDWRSRFFLNKFKLGTAVNAAPRLAGGRPHTL